jgi:hypothetical protein
MPGDVRESAIARWTGEPQYVPTIATPADRDGLFNERTMKDDQARRERKAGTSVNDSRANRLKLALRENLKRRKSQARGRNDLTAASSEEVGAALDDGNGKEPDQ